MSRFDSAGVAAGAGVRPPKSTRQKIHMGCDFAIDRPKALRYKPRHTGRDNGLAGAMNSRLVSAKFTASRDG
ncbi:hypothetical protein, partial [Azospirillum sp. Sh1]|uniref:hypothetical protein n=1 Tax=Azospirillum sp. Sh1 TaxID=2607285 RepID=UPI001B3BF20B